MNNLIVRNELIEIFEILSTSMHTPIWLKTDIYLCRSFLYYSCKRNTSQMIYIASLKIPLHTFEIYNILGNEVNKNIPIHIIMFASNREQVRPFL